MSVYACACASIDRVSISVGVGVACIWVFMRGCVCVCVCMYVYERGRKRESLRECVGASVCVRECHARDTARCLIVCWLKGHNEGSIIMSSYVLH